MLERKGWSEFKEAGLLWWVNCGLHLFGWAIVFDVDDDGSISNVYPAHCKFRGFPTDVDEQGYEALTKHLAARSGDLVADFSE